jgi:hypothetical protein
MKKISPGALAALLVMALLAAPAYAGPTVTVRVEGESATLLERTTVTLPDDPPYDPCTQKWTVAAAIEQATNGNWDRREFASTILGESHTFSDSDYWALWNGDGAGYRYSQLGICDTVMREGEEALMLVDRTPPPDFASTSFPLGLRGVPAAVQAGTPVTVSVVSYALDGTATPVDGAAVSGGGAGAVTGADGTAVLTFPQPGAFVVRASKPGRVVSAGERTTVSAGPVALPRCETSGTDGRCGTKDLEAPVISIADLTNGGFYTRKRAPRTIAGRVLPDPSGLEQVRLSIKRKLGRRCWRFSGATERFERRRCDGWRSFVIGDQAEWSYLLPKRLARGRYAIRAVAVDNAGNHSVRRVRIRVG